MDIYGYRFADCCWNCDHGICHNDGVVCRKHKAGVGKYTLCDDYVCTTIENLDRPKGVGNDER